MYKKLTPEDYITSSIIRFGSHDKYIQEKILVDFFVIKGNMKIAEGLRNYIKKHLKELKSMPKIRLLDVGPAIGAITTMLALQELDRCGLLEKTQVYLADVSQRVIDKTREGDFYFPKAIINSLLKRKIMKKLKNLKGYVCSASNLPFKNDYFDIAVAGFLFNNLHNQTKFSSAKQIERVIKKNGFIGIADQWFRDYKKEYCAEHANDVIPLAYESIMSMDKILKFFTSTYIRERSRLKDVSKENYYYFCGEKR
ncbi:methyltransferase domain-containing protein [Candidatus Peregrinibacteria bacterium]|nr:methyltransferase domain-containing protein [Candidatus Peregrinibacteria bacterium]